MTDLAEASQGYFSDEAVVVELSNGLPTASVQADGKPARSVLARG